jgi:hypothetical protein
MTLLVTSSANKVRLVVISMMGRSDFDEMPAIVTVEGFHTALSVTWTFLQFSSSHAVGTRVSKYTVVPSILNGTHSSALDIPNGLVVSVGSSDKVIP